MWISACGTESVDCDGVPDIPIDERAMSCYPFGTDESRPPTQEGGAPSNAYVGGKFSQGVAVQCVRMLQAKGSYRSDRVSSFCPPCGHGGHGTRDEI